MLHSLPSSRAGLLGSLFQGYEGPAFSIRLWDGWRWSSRPDETPAFTISIATPAALASFLFSSNEITLGEAFIHRALDIDGDLFAVFSVAEYLFGRSRDLKQRLMGSILRAAADAGRWFRHGAQSCMRRDCAAISYHYDQPLEFFRPWLGNSLVYSCAYFRTADDSLDRAQTQKLETICRKLRIEPGEHFLDIGCGWGSLVLYAAGEHHAHACGITLSQSQAETAKRRIAEAGLNTSCSVELLDYRQCKDLYGSFDKIASVGMYEHVGLKNLRQYFKIAYQLLRPGGVFLNHGIARSSVSPVRNDSFIERYVFPDGRLVTLPQALQAAEAAGLEVRDVENLREHYERTLCHWVEGLRQNEPALLKHVPESTYRIWLLYMAGSAAAFRKGDIAVYQVLLSRPDGGHSRLPLVREDWYRQRRQEVGCG